MAAILVAAALTGMAARDLPALINPSFTPVHLVRQAGLIVELEVKPAIVALVGEVPHQWHATVKRTLKGKLNAGSITFNLTTCAVKEHIQLLEKDIKAGAATPAVLFAGAFEEKAGEAILDFRFSILDYGFRSGASFGRQSLIQNPKSKIQNQLAEPANERKGYLYLNGSWAAFYEAKDGTWELDDAAPVMLTTWQGGTDMLLRATEYILADEDAYLPVREGVSWAAAKRFGKISGKVSAAMPVDLVGDGKWALYVASDEGDRLFEYDPKEATLKDTTDAHKLSAKSRCAAWGDFNRDGRLDLASCDGESVTVYAQEEDGTLQAGLAWDTVRTHSKCLALAVVDSDVRGRPDLLVSTTEDPLLLLPGAGEKGLSVIYLGKPLPREPLGETGPCIVADLDGDGIPDVLQLFQKSSLFYKGTSPAHFAPPERCAVAAGKGNISAFLGDFDADGLLDVFTISDEARRLWQNSGKMRFTECLALCGEASYKVEPGAVAGVTGDFNNDGRQDFVLFYGAAFPRSFFNRGFRSFGFTNALDIGTNDLLPAAGEGQQAGTLADFNGDGAQDLVLILKNGEAWMLPRQTGEVAPLCVRAALAPKGNCAGPVSVMGCAGNRCLGAWNVVAGTSEAFVGVDEPGMITLKWQLPGKPPEKKDVLVERKPVRVVVGPN